jgi:hypothetical protein
MDQLELASQPTPEYRTIPLTKGKVTIVDAADYEWLMRWKWYATWCENSQTFYAVRSSSRKEIGGRHQIYMHREILGLKRGDPRQGDHEEITETLDNRRSNLRISTVLQNKQNARATRQNTSGFIGVVSHPYGWCAVISHLNKRIHIGLFKTKERAARARDRKAIELRGRFARLNFPREDYGFNPS